jgi:hypothetical protein
MGKEIAELEAHGTWTIVRKESMSDGANLLPSTWALKIKRYPDGRMRKNKARFCVRGDKQIAGVDYFESYAPVASWSTVRMVMNLAIQRGWATRQVDFSNASRRRFMWNCLKCSEMRTILALRRGLS